MMAADTENRPGDVLPLEIYARRREWGRGVSISMRRVIFGVEANYAKPIVYAKEEVGNFIEPMLDMSIHEAQTLMDELWGCGLRPSEGSGSAGSLAATERHLKDMRAIAFHKLNVKP